MPVFEETWFYAPLRDQAGPQPFPEEEAHHAFGVLRLRPGQDVVVSDGQGGVWLCVLEGGRERATVTVKAPRSERPSPPRGSLALALLKGRDCEDPVAAACELPLAHIHLLMTEHTQAFSGQDHQRLLTRLRQKSVAALKQARKPHLTQIHAPVKLRDWVANQGDAAMILAHPGKDDLPVTIPESFALLVGPEGGFSPQEIAWLAGQKHAYRLALGETRLRATHAPLIGLGKLMGLGWI